MTYLSERSIRGNRFLMAILIMLLLSVSLPASRTSASLCEPGEHPLYPNGPCVPQSVPQIPFEPGYGSSGLPHDAEQAYLLATMQYEDPIIGEVPVRDPITGQIVFRPDGSPQTRPVECRPGKREYYHADYLGYAGRLDCTGGVPLLYIEMTYEGSENGSVWYELEGSAHMRDDEGCCGLLVYGASDNLPGFRARVHYYYEVAFDYSGGYATRHLYSPVYSWPGN